MSRFLQEVHLGQQLLIGAKEYRDVDGVYSIVILKHKIPEFKTINMYHHYHEHQNVWDPESRFSIPGNKLAFIDLWEFTKEFYELKTQADFLFYFLKKADSMSYVIAT